MQIQDTRYAGYQKETVIRYGKKKKEQMPKRQNYKCLEYYDEKHALLKCQLTER